MSKDTSHIEEHELDITLIPAAFPSLQGLDSSTLSSRALFGDGPDEPAESRRLSRPETASSVEHPAQDSVLDVYLQRPNNCMSPCLNVPQGEAPKAPEPSSVFDDVPEDNFLSVNVLLELHDDSCLLAAANWKALDISLHVVERQGCSPSALTMGSPVHEDCDTTRVVHPCLDSEYIPIEGTDTFVLQKSMEIQLPPVRGSEELSFFDVNITFNEKAYLADWRITASCYIGLHSAKKVLYPVRCSFVRALVDISGQVPTFYCSFAVRRYARRHSKERAAAQRDDELSHSVPQQKTLEEEYHREDGINPDSVRLQEVKALDSPNLRSSSSHGMRPIGPNGRLMTAAQRETFASIRKRFAKTAARDWKMVLLDADLYPLFTLGRDECAKEMGTCPTWLKVRMRERGIKVWPNRKLIPTTSSLYRLKKQRAEVAKKDITAPRPDLKEELQRIEDEIADIRTQRLKIVQDSCSPEFFTGFVASTPITVLDPDWEC